METRNSRARPHGDLKVLLAEDDDGDAKAVLRAFRKARVANGITRAVDGVEALDYLREQAAKSGSSRRLCCWQILTCPA